MGTEFNLAEEMMKLLLKQARLPHKYVNPHFLTEVMSALDDYYDLENDEVYEWINNMWST